MAMSRYEALLKPLPWQGRWFVNAFVLLALLYLFLLGLDLMGNAFKGLSGKGVGNMLSVVDNPMAGLAIGVVATVLLQSSSTTTSIIVTMVGAGILNVTNAIPMVMGANIGTSVTAALVSHGHIADTAEFIRGFEGSSVHGAFNMLTVLTLLPLEIITQACGAGLLMTISSGIADGLVGASASTFESPVKTIVKPLSSLFIKIDKDLIKTIAKGCLPCGDAQFAHPEYCLDHEEDPDDPEEKIDICVANDDWTQRYETDGRVVKDGFAADMGDASGSLVVLVISLIFLCLALYGIVRLLHYLVLSSGREAQAGEGESAFVRRIEKVVRYNPYLSIVYGMLMTIAVQSSSITTSALTPLVALGIISVEDMLPLTLGANIGTTCTAFLASLVTEKKDAIQISLCHFFFNIIGIAIWFPHPRMRAVPLKMGKVLSQHLTRFKLFGAFYIFTMFILLPLMLLGASFTIQLGVGGIVLNVLLDVLILAGTAWCIVHFDRLAAGRLSETEAAQDPEKVSTGDKSTGTPDTAEAAPPLEVSI